MSSVVVSKIRRNVEDYGWSTALRKVVAYLLKPIYFQRVYRVFRINLDEPRPELDTISQSFTFKILTPNDKSTVSQIERMAEWLHDELEAKIRAGSLCFVALNGEEVAGFNLVSFGKVFVPLLNTSWVFRPKEAWSEHIAILKNYRKQGLGSQLGCVMFKELQNRGFKRVYGGTLISNLASQKRARKVGFRVFVDVHYRKLMGFQTWHYKRVRQWAVAPGRAA
jgi:RimJ/RimL family protein N-acetyltransferase